MSRKRSSWLRLSFDVWRTGLEAQQVIALRLAKLARGGASATNEANRMVSEKMAAAVEAQRRATTALLTGKAAQIPARTLALYRRKVRANRASVDSLAFVLALTNANHGLPRSPGIAATHAPSPHLIHGQRAGRQRAEQLRLRPGEIEQPTATQSSRHA